jgi:hypothetical protein
VDSGQIVQLLAHLQAKHVHVRGRWVQCSCPLSPWNHDSGKDSSPSFAIRVEPNKESYFNCFVCESGSLSDLVLKLQYFKAQNLGYQLGEAWKLIEIEEAQKINLTVKEWGEKEAVEEEKVIHEGWLAQFQKAWPVPMAREYLEGRHVSQEITEALDVRWDKSMRTVCFPIRNRMGELVSLRGRRVDPKSTAPPYNVYTPMGDSPHQSWMGEQHVDFDKPILLVESVFDVASVLRVYRNVMAPLSVGINQERIKRLAKASEIVTLFDRGVGGDKARQIVQYHMGTALVTHIIPEAKDPGEMTEEMLRNQLNICLNLLPISV